MIGKYKCFMTKKDIHTTVIIMSFKRGAVAKIKVDRGVHYNNKGAQHPSKVA